MSTTTSPGCEACHTRRPDHTHPAGCTCEWEGARRTFLGSMARIPDDRCPVHGRCAWVDCDRPGWHEHPTAARWANPHDPDADALVVLIARTGTVSISEPALAQILTAAGWEREA